MKGIEYMDRVISSEYIKNYRLIRIQDQHNEFKIWHIKRYARGEYYANESIGGVAYQSFKRMPLKRLKEVGVYE